MIFIDSDKKRIYEVPIVAHNLEILGDGLRRYTPTVSAPDIVKIDLLADIYSPWVLHRSDDDGDHADLAFRREGGSVIDEDETGKTNAPTELYLRNDFGWRIVLANYPHEYNIIGNLRPQDSSISMFDFSPLDTLGAYPLIERSADLIVRTTLTGVSPQQAAQIFRDVLDEKIC